MLLVLFACVSLGALLFMAIGNTNPAFAAVGGAIAGFFVFLLIGLFWLLGQAYDGCNSLDADDMCVDTPYGEVR